jgi:hypothetical protein
MLAKICKHTKSLAAARCNTNRPPLT